MDSWEAQVAQMVKNLPANSRDASLIPGSGTSSGEGNGNLPQYSCLEIPWTEEPGRLESIGLQRAGYNLVTKWQKQLDNTTVQFSSVTQSCPTLCDPMDCSTLGLPVHHQLPEFTQTHDYWVSDAIHPSHPLSSPSPPAFNLSQHQGLFKWVSSLHQVAKLLEFQLQHQSFQWIFKTDLL